MHPSCRWFFAAACWLMACLVGPGAFRVAAAISVSRTAPAGTSPAADVSSLFASASPETSSSSRSLGGGLFNKKKTLPKASANAAAAAAAAAALAAISTGTLSLGMEGRPAASGLSPSPAAALLRRRDCLLAALGASLGPPETLGGPQPPCLPLGPPRLGCPAAANAKWIRECVEGRLQQQQQQQDLSVVSNGSSAGGAGVPRMLSTVSDASLKAILAGIDAVRNRAISMYRDGEEVFACSLRAVQARRRQGLWAPLSASWVQRLTAKGVVMRRIDAGGGGDCLFHSVALGVAGTDRQKDALELRRIAADKAAGIRACEKDAALSPVDSQLFLERLGVMAALEAGADWHDGWSPSAILEGGKAYVATTGFVFDTSTTLGKARAVHHEMRLPGNNHWGTAADICALEDALDVGIVVMDDSTGKIYPTVCEQKKRSLYLFVYFVGGCHFQLVGLETPEGHKTLFSPKELPACLLQLFKEDTKNELLLPSLSGGRRREEITKEETLQATSNGIAVEQPQ